MMTRKLAALVAVATVASASTPAIAQDRPYSEGPVVNMASIRTMDGKFDEYMAWIATTWKKQEEAGKKLGDVLR